MHAPFLSLRVEFPLGTEGAVPGSAECPGWDRDWVPGEEHPRQLRGVPKARGHFRWPQEGSFLKGDARISVKQGKSMADSFSKTLS